METWKTIPEFPMYAVSSYGRVRNQDSERIMALSVNQFDVVFVGLFGEGDQYKRSVPKLVAEAFIPRPFGPFDTPINMDGDRFNNHVDNLAWRPRWFAIEYNRQFKIPYHRHIPYPILDINTKEVTDNSFECARRYGLLEKEVVLSIINRTYAWPTYQEFQALGESTY